MRPASPRIPSRSIEARNPVTASPVATRNLGKPTPVAGDITVDISTLVNPLPAGTYKAVVRASGPGGTTASAPSDELHEVVFGSGLTVKAQERSARVFSRGFPGALSRPEPFPRLYCWPCVVVDLSCPSCACSRSASCTDREPERQPRSPRQAVKPAPKTEPANVTCPEQLGTGVKTKAEFCFVLAGREPADGVLVSIPPHSQATLTFDLHNRHSYSEEEIRAGRGFAKYTAVIGVLSMTGDLLGRGAVQTEFRTARICTTASPAAQGLGDQGRRAPGA